MSSALPILWLFRCPLCGDRIRVELPPDTAEGEAGTAICSGGHEVLFGRNGVTACPVELIGDEL
jgi:hypothetical protein